MAMGKCFLKDGGISDATKCQFSRKPFVEKGLFMSPVHSGAAWGSLGGPALTNCFADGAVSPL